jgi:SET domain-containing protein
MCNCYNCQIIHDEFIELIDNLHEYPNKDLKELLEPYVYQMIKRSKDKLKIIKECPDTTKYCEVFDTELIGMGVKSIVDISPKTVIGCYLGKIEPQSNKNVDWKYSFAYALNGYVVDGSEKLSMMSYVNHSRKPNVEVDYQIHNVNGKQQCHIAFITNQYIFSGEELFIDYGNEYWKWASNLGYVEIGYSDSERPLKRQRKITEYFSK